MGLDDLELLGAEPAGLQENVVDDSHLADVMQGRGRLKGADIGLVDARRKAGKARVRSM